MIVFKTHCSDEFATTPDLLALDLTADDVARLREAIPAAYTSKKRPLA